MNRTIYSRAWPIVLTWTCIAFGLSLAGAADPKPNIVVIMNDDLGYADVGFWG